MGFVSKAATDEISNYEYLYDKIEDDLLKNRVKISLKYYINKANEYKCWWFVLTASSVILPALATFVSVAVVQHPGAGWLVALITALTTITTGLLGTFKIAEKKSTYRDLAEHMKQVLSVYLYSRKGLEDSKKIEELTARLSEEIEQIIAEEKVKIDRIEKRENT